MVAFCPPSSASRRASELLPVAEAEWLRNHDLVEWLFFPEKTRENWRKTEENREKLRKTGENWEKLGKNLEHPWENLEKNWEDLGKAYFWLRKMQDSWIIFEVFLRFPRKKRSIGRTVAPFVWFPYGIIRVAVSLWHTTYL